MTAVRFPDRAVIAVTGDEAAAYLQRVITCDMGAVRPGAWTPGALLTPQGKVIADFLITGVEDGVLIDVFVPAAETLVKRLSLYRLRAKAQLALRLDLCVISGEGAADPRHPDLPPRAVRDAASAAGLADGGAAQHAAEIAAGVPAFGRDYGEAEAFPTDVNLDVYGGVGWKKGCFIGQEVLSRMKRRGTIRKRSLPLHVPGGAPEKGTPLLANETPVGEITSAQGDRAVALVRMDRVDKGGALSVDGKPARLERPGWLENA
ncbi:MAG: folate-binding protein YgfZ [Maricaulaceae bacterium]|nr:folate-binding protein YgfZ [Maricaulaceae bacterium]